MKSNQKQVLLIICDLSTDIIKNTRDLLSQDIAPSQTVVLTTDQIRQELSNTELDISVLPDKSKDDYVLQTIRDFTTCHDIELICCVAGNTELSISTANAMALSARYQDRLCYVIDDPIKITDIPFPRLRYLYQDKCNNLSGTLAETVELANLRISRHIDAPEVYLSTDPPICMIGKNELRFEPDEFLLFWLLATRCKNQIIPIQGTENLLDEYHAFIGSTISTIMPEICEIREDLLKYTETDILRVVESLTKKIKNNLPFDNGLDFALPQRDQSIYGISFPADNISCPRNY